MPTTDLPEDPNDHVQVWDGSKFEIVTRKTAQQLARSRTHQITENLRASDLKTPKEIAADVASKPGRKRKYPTRQMKADK